VLNPNSAEPLSKSTPMQSNSKQVKLTNTRTFKVITAMIGLIDLWMFVYLYDTDIRGIMLSFAYPDRVILSVGGQGVFLSEVVFLGSITALVAGVGTLMWLLATFLNQAVVVKMDGVYRLTENQIGKFWKCEGPGACGEFFEYEAWLEYAVFRGINAGKIMRLCLICKTEIDLKAFEPAKEIEPSVVKETSRLLPIIQNMKEKKAEIKDEVKEPGDIGNKEGRKKKKTKRPKPTMAVKPVVEVDPKTRKIRARMNKEEFKKDNVERFQ